jgi:hypothetical protein
MLGIYYVPIHFDNIESPLGLIGLQIGFIPSQEYKIRYNKKL